MEIPDDVFAVMQQVGPHDDFGYYSFKSLSKILGWDVRRIKVACHTGRDMGLLRFASGLMTDDGEPYGSGYALTDKGMGMV